jgi:catechol 2,3-dioxygenase-like lactoylglutathione lyase family enzyme
VTFSIDRIDHVVINCRDAEATAAWYHEVLGMAIERFGGDGRIALRFGQQKLNVRPSGAPNWVTGAVDAAGSLDLCFITSGSPDTVVEHLRQCGVDPFIGPVTRDGALGPMTSVYCRDPDGNLVEIAAYGAPPGGDSP